MCTRLLARRGGVNLLQMHQRLVLPARGLVIAETVTFATSAKERITGLLGTATSQPGRALVLSTRQVHTFGMRYPIDVVFCGRDWEVLHVARSMRPNRVSRVVMKSRWTVELVAGAAEAVEVGDRLSPEPASDGDG